jgi:hypothetical protein
VEFHKYHRILEHEECKVLFDNVTRYRSWDPFSLDSYEFKTTPFDHKFTKLPERGCFHVKENVQDAISNFYSTHPVIDILLDVQMSAFTNARIDELNLMLDQGIMRNRLNSWFEKHYAPKWILSLIGGVPVPTKYPWLSKFYLGQRLLIIKNCHKSVGLNQVIVKLVKNVTQTTSPNTNPLTIVTETKSNFVFSGVHNGEFGIVCNIFRFYHEKNELVDYRATHILRSPAFEQSPFMLALELWNPQIDVKTGAKPSAASLIETLKYGNPKETKYVLVNDKMGIPLSTFVPGWVVSIDKYQGAQSKTMLLDFQPNDGAYFTKEHGLVAISRMEERFLIFGDLDELYRMAKNNRSSRKVDLEWRLKQLWRTFYS